MAYEKYLPGGSINPYWAYEQEMSRLKQDIQNDIDCFMEQLQNSILGCVTIIEQPVEMCKIIHNGEQSCRSLNEELETKFDFVKRHSDSPEDLELAKEIIGLINTKNLRYLT